MNIMDSIFRPWGRRAKTYALLVLAFLLTFSGISVHPASANGEPAPTSQEADTFPIGIFWPPVWAHTNEEQYGYIKDAHIDYIQNVSSTDLDTVEKNMAMLDLAQAAGLKVQVSDARTKTILQLSDEEIVEMVNDYKTHPAVYGYYVKDEPTPSELEDYAAVYNKVLAADPARIPSLNLLPKTWAIPNYKGYVEGWINAVGASNLKLLSFDFYPFPAAPAGTVSEDYYVTLEQIKESGLKYNLDTAGYLQSFGIPGVYRRPNVNEMRYNVYTLLSYGVKNPIWFTWWTPTSQAEDFEDGIIDREGNKTDFYEPVKQLNADMKNMGRTLLHLDAKYVYHQGAAQKGTKTLPEDFIMLPQNPNDDLIVTYFSNRNDGKNYVMVVNKSLTAAKTITFQLDPTLAAADMKEITAASEGEAVVPAFDAAENTVTAAFLPGEGKLYALPAGYTYIESNDLPNVLVNGGFEQGLWPTHRGAELDTAIRRKGQSVKLAASGAQVYVESAAARIGKMNKHAFSIWLKTDNVSAPDGVKVQLVEVDENGFDVGVHPQAISTGGTTGWRKYEIPDLHTSATAIRVIVKTMPGVTGTVWADEAVLTDESNVEILTDELSGFDYIYKKSPNFWFDGSNTHIAEGDDSRLMRTSDADEYIVYKRDSISKFEAKLYTGNTDYVEFYVSPDEESWLPVTVKDINKKNTADGWFTVTKSSESIPPGMNYLKAVFLGSNEYNWYPQLGQMKITYGYDAAQDDSLIANGGFENGLWNVQRGAVLDASEKHGGGASAKMGADATGQWMSSSIAYPDPAQRHDLSVWLKTEGMADSKGVRVELMEVDANGNDIGLVAGPKGLIETGGTHGWTKFSLEGIRIKSPGVRVIVRTAPGTAGTVWVDDVRLTDVPAYGTLVDDLNSYDAVLEKSGNLWLDGNNADVADGDESRLTRTADTDEYLIYRQEEISKFSVQLYTGSTDYIDFYVSPDKTAWTQVEVETSEKVPTSRDWYKLTKTSVSIPPGMNYFKMVVRGDNEFSWYPQVGQITLTSGYGDDVFGPPANLLKNAGFEAGLWANRQGAALETSVTKSGGAAVKLTADAEGSFVASYPARIDPEQAYALSLWLKTDGISSADGVRIEIAQLDYEGNAIGLYTPKSGQLTAGGTKDWTMYSVPAIYPLDAATASLQVKVRTKSGVTGEVYVDDLLLAATDIPSNPGDGGGTPIVITPTPEDRAVQQVSAAQLQAGKGTIELQAGKQLLSLPMNADELLGAFSLTVRAGQASVALPAGVLKALREQATREALDATAIIVKLSPAQVPAEVGDSALRSGETMYELELYAVNAQGKETRLSSFAEAVRIELPYASSQNADLVGIYYYNETTRTWEYVGGTADAGKGVVSAELRHFSKYAVMEYDKQFADVPPTHWASQAIKALAAKHVVSGVDGSRFQPGGVITRAEFTAMLARAFALNPASEPVPFKDVAADAWYADAVGAAYAAGLVQGVAGNRFAPGAQITREQMATLLVRAMAYAKREAASANAGLEGYQDRAAVSGWAVEAVNQAVQAGIMKGKKPGYFNPADQVTRAETAQAIWNLLQK